MNHCRVAKDEERFGNEKSNFTISKTLPMCVCIFKCLFILFSKAMHCLQHL